VVLRFITRFKVGIWASLCGLSALAGLAGILLASPTLAALGRDFQPMGVIAAWMSLVLAAALFLAESGRRRVPLRALSFLGAAVVTGVLANSLLVPKQPRDASLAVLGYLGACLSLGLLTAFRSRAWLARQGAAFMALAPLMVGSLVLFSYLAGVPFLYRMELRPTSLPTALCLFFTGHALLALAGEDTFPLNLFSLDRLEMPASSRPWLNRLPLVAFIVLASLGGLAGAFMMRAQVETFRRSARIQLAELADAKAEKLDRWLEERRGDAETIRRAGLIQEALAGFLREARGPGEIHSWMQSLVDLYGYDSVALYDAGGRVVASQGTLGAPLSKEACGRAMALNKVSLEDLQGQGAAARFGFWVPVAGADGIPLGAVNLTVALEPFLQRFLTDWPAMGPAGDCSVLYRQQGGRTLALEAGSRGLSTPDEVQALWALGAAADRVTGGRDLRGRQVVSLRPVAGTPWRLAVRLRESDLLVLLRPRFWTTAMGTLGLVLLVALATGFLVRRYGGLRIREKLALEEERKALAERSRVLMEEANDIILLMAPDGRIVEANGRALAAYGRSPGELLGMPVRELRAVGTDGFDAQWDRMMTQGSGVWETLHRRKDGTPFPVEASTRVVVQGGETYILAFLRDITERQEQAREIHHLTQLYAALGQVGQAVVWTRDRQDLRQRICGVLVEFGQMGAAWIATVDPETGALALAAQGQGSAAGAEDPLLRFRSASGEADPLETVLRTGRPIILETLARSGSAAAFPVAQAGRITHILGVETPDRNYFGPEEMELLEETALDLSFALDKLDDEARRARAEADLLAAGQEQKRLERQLIQSQKMESLGSLAGGVAHDLNNVLGAILSLASAFQEDTGLAPRLAKGLDTIVNACLRGRGVIKSLLYFARKGLEEEHVLDLNTLVRDLVQLLAHTTLKRVDLVLDLDEALPPVLGDGGALSHAVMNLCVNAVDAMPGGGTLTLRTGRVPGGGVHLTVEDTGVGMDAAVQEKAMEPFFTTKPQGKGTGLGLSMVFGTLKAHGGSMDLVSRPGEGTTVRLNLPATRVRAGASGIGAHAANPRGAHRVLTILLVDDDELIREAVAPMLEILGHRVRTAAGGTEALELLEGGLELDLVILDMNMPGMTGAETLPLLLALRPELPVLLASGYSDQHVTELMAGRPGVRSLRKPFTLAEIRAVLDCF
jgi:PAS domain S-box-containing protein